ncbi:GlcG/HbpS family heme-binding protein [Rubrobacter marinus]|uniref:GlcG/HbpS family heme-binding protein n=1 Tax=Rubrobacter marinus TaxID=2653852 RepID=UPI001D1953A3|nr:heme-binding protein [Rubrobacter marinus]
MENIQSVTLEEAQAVAQAAIEKAREMGQPMNVAVAEVGGRLKAFARMETAWTASISIAQDKAFTSATLGFSTQEIGEMAQPGQPLFGINTTNGGRIVIFGGGVPLMRDGHVVGAVGVSGGTPAQDHEVAEAGVAAFG